jgi:preprotein translocase subunit YajC
MTDFSSLPLVAAQAGAPAPGAPRICFWGLIVGVLFFLLIRPQPRGAMEQLGLVDVFKKNDKVVTSGGLHGRVVEVHKDHLALEIAPKVIVHQERSQITAVGGEKQDK